MNKNAKVVVGSIIVLCLMGGSYYLGLQTYYKGYTDFILEYSEDIYYECQRQLPEDYCNNLVYEIPLGISHTNMEEDTNGTE